MKQLQTSESSTTTGQDKDSSILKQTTRRKKKRLIIFGSVISALLVVGGIITFIIVKKQTEYPPVIYNLWGGGKCRYKKGALSVKFSDTLSPSEAKEYIEGLDLSVTLWEYQSFPYTMSFTTEASEAENLIKQLENEPQILSANVTVFHFDSDRTNIPSKNTITIGVDIETSPSEVKKILLEKYHIDSATISKSDLYGTVIVPERQEENWISKFSDDTNIQYVSWDTEGCDSGPFP